MEFLFDLFIDFIRGIHLIGFDFPRWLPKSKMAARKKKGNVIYLAAKIENEQMRCQFRCFLVTETDAGHDMLLGSPVSKMAAKIQDDRQKKRKMLYIWL